MGAHRKYWTCSCGAEGEYKAEGGAHARLNPDHDVQFDAKRPARKAAQLAWERRRQDRARDSAVHRESRELRAAAGRCCDCGVNRPYAGRVSCLACLFKNSKSKMARRSARRAAEAEFIAAHPGLFGPGDIGIMPGVKARLGRRVQGGHLYGLEVLDAGTGERLALIPLRRLML